MERCLKLIGRYYDVYCNETDGKKNGQTKG